MSKNFTTIVSISLQLLKTKICFNAQIMINQTFKMERIIFNYLKRWLRFKIYSRLLSWSPEKGVLNEH